MLVGIKLGSHASCIAIQNKDETPAWVYGQARVIANEDGDHQIPSFVSFHEGEILTGTPAKSRALRNPFNTLIDFQHLLGVNSAEDPIIAHLQQKHAFKIQTENEIGFEINLNETSSVVTPKYVAGLQLASLVATAENYAGEKAEGVVLTVPVGFSHEARKDLLSAAEEANIPVLHFITDPVASLIGCGWINHDQNANTTFLVIDLGGSTLDISVISVQQGIVNIVAAESTHELNASLFDDILAQYFASEFARKSKSKLQQPSAAYKKLLMACEQTKKTLSHAMTAFCNVESLSEGLDFAGNIPRARFEMLCDGLVLRFKSIVESFVARHQHAFDQVCFIGGGSRIPRLQSAVAEMFGLKHKKMSVDSVDAMAIGAALESGLIASMLNAENRASILSSIRPWTIQCATVSQH